MLNTSHSGYFINYYFNGNALKSRCSVTITSLGLNSYYELQVNVIIQKFCALERLAIFKKWTKEGEEFEKKSH